MYVYIYIYVVYIYNFVNVVLHNSHNSLRLLKILTSGY